MASAAGDGGRQRKESKKARFHASLGQRKIPLGGTWRGKMSKTYSEWFLLKNPPTYLFDVSPSLLLKSVHTLNFPFCVAVCGHVSK